MRQRTHTRYALQWLLVCLLLIAAAATFNLVVDPYGVWRVVDIAGVNSAKPAQLNHDYLFKAADVMRLKPRTVFLGSSRVAYGLDPKHPALAGRGPVYNLAILGANMHVLRRYFDHALYNNPQLNTVVLGADFFAFGKNVKAPPAFRDERIGRRHLWPKDVVTTLFSVDALADSVETVASNVLHPGEEPYFPDGMMTAENLQAIADQGHLPARFKNSADEYLNRANRFDGFSFNEDAFRDLAHIVHVCRRRGIRLVVFVPPVHATLLEAMRLRGVWGDFQTWKRRLAALTPYWDFSGYNSITTEPVARKMKWYWDMSHFRRGAGNLVLDRIFAYRKDRVPQDFGVRITAANVEARLQDVDLERTAWMAHSQERLAWLKAQLR